MYEGEGGEEYFTGPVRYPNFIHEIFKVGGQTPLFKYVKLMPQYWFPFLLLVKKLLKFPTMLLELLHQFLAYIILLGLENKCVRISKIKL